MLFKTSDVDESDSSNLFRRRTLRSREIGSEDEEIVLDFGKEGIDFSVCVKGAAGSDCTIEFINRAVRL